MNSFSKLMFDVGDTIGERFKVLRVLRGSMGVVYVVRDFKRIEGMESPKIMIAKSLHPELANYPFISRRFEEEAKLWIKIKPHNHILRAYFVNKFHEIFYIFADYIERGLLPNTLSGWIQKKITPPEVAVFILTQIVEGLEFAYQNNVAFHGDLKPANILIRNSSCVQIADWGLSRMEEKPLARIKLMKSIQSEKSFAPDDLVHRSTPGYAAPELGKGKQQTNKALDIFSLGVIFGEMLCGKRFESDVTLGQLHDALESCFALSSGIRENIKKILSDFLKSDPDDRMRDYDDNLKLLEELCGGMAEITFRPPDMPIDQYEWSRKVAQSMVQLGDESQAYNEFSNIANQREQRSKNGQRVFIDFGNADPFDFPDPSKAKVLIPQNAIEAMEEKLKEDPDDIETILGLAGAFLYSDNYDRCRELYERALEIDNKNESAILGLINLFERFDRKQELLKFGRKLAENVAFQRKVDRFKV